MQIPITLTLAEQLQSEHKRIMQLLHVVHSKEAQIEVVTDSIPSTKWSNAKQAIIPFEIDCSLDTVGTTTTEKNQATPAASIQIPTQRSTKPKKRKFSEQTIDYPCSLFLPKCYSDVQSVRRRSSVLTRPQKPFTCDPSHVSVDPAVVHSFLQSLSSGECPAEEQETIQDDWSVVSDRIEESVIEDEELLRIVMEEETVDLLNFIEDARKREGSPIRGNSIKKIKSLLLDGEMAVPQGESPTLSVSGARGG